MLIYFIKEYYKRRKKMSSVGNKINEKIAKEQLEKHESLAHEYIDNPKKLKKLIDDAVQKVNNTKGPLDNLISNLRILFMLVQDWINGNYKEIPSGSIVVIVAAILYFFSPIDLIPDFIPVVGYFDDALVVSFAIKQIKSDIEKYKEWKEI
jgi:uncharacterized membrane protein YkvA (DUF1232 family)